MNGLNIYGVILAGLGAALLSAGCAGAEQSGTIPSAKTVIFQSEHSESALPYEGGLILSSTRGSISYRKDGKTDILIPQDAGLHMPTGMAVKEHWLFIADGNRVAVFDLNALSEPFQEIVLAEDDTSVNDVFVEEDSLYTSVTGTGRIYRTDISNLPDLSGAVSEVWAEVPGPNGITVGDGKMYIASISPDYQSTNPENVIYVADLESPVPEAVEGVEPGRYDGVTLSDDGQLLYFSDWNTASVTAMVLATGEMETVYQEDGIGPADIDEADGILYIPDMNGNRILAVATERE